MLMEMKVASRPRLPYSSRYIADETPTGIENRAVNEISQTVPYSADLIPALAGNRDGKLVRNGRSSQA